jgi:hypothetical protein
MVVSWIKYKLKLIMLPLRNRQIAFKVRSSDSFSVILEPILWRFCY